MFNLEQAITSWRKTLSAGGIRSPEILDELEDHLREEMQIQTRDGTSEEQAFQTATAHVGSAEILQTEFRKARNSWPASLRVAYLLFVVGVVFISSWALLRDELSVWQKCIGLLTTFLTGVYLCLLPRLAGALIRRSLPFVGAFVKFGSLFIYAWMVWLLLDAFGIRHLESDIVVTMGATVAIFTFAHGSHSHGFLIGRFSNQKPQSQNFPKLPPTSDVKDRLAFAILNPAARNALEQARTEALQRGHAYVGTEHVLLALMARCSERFNGVFAESDLSREAVVKQVEGSIEISSPKLPNALLPLTPRVRTAFQLAAREARQTKETGVGIEHLFLGLLRERGGVAGRVLRQLGLSLKGTRKELLGT